jgi:cell surface protein SprA
MHGYTSIYAVGNYRIDASVHDAQRGDDGYSYIRDELNAYFLPETQIGGVTLSEQFSPLYSIDLNFNLGLTARFEHRKGRNISLSLANNQLVEMITQELIFGAGWRLEQLPINIRVGGNTTGFKSDLNLRADIALRDNFTIIHKLDQDADQITAGQKSTSIKLSADYNLSKSFNLRFFYDQTINTPRVSTSWRTSNTQIGFSLRFTLM